MKLAPLLIGCLLLSACECPSQELSGMKCVEAATVANGCPVCTKYEPEIQEIQCLPEFLMEEEFQRERFGIDCDETKCAMWCKHGPCSMQISTGALLFLDCR